MYIDISTSALPTSQAPQDISQKSCHLDIKILRIFFFPFIVLQECKIRQEGSPRDKETRRDQYGGSRYAVSKEFGVLRNPAPTLIARQVHLPALGLWKLNLLGHRRLLLVAAVRRRSCVLFCVLQPFCPIGIEGADVTSEVI